MSAAPVAYPMIFTIRELVSSQNFMAGITASGRALMVKEGDGAWWLYGVEPGGIAETGVSPQEAYLRFVEAFKAILSDIATGVAEFEKFQESVKHFFHEADESEGMRWQQALDAIRSGTLVPGQPFSSLPKQPADTPRFVSVERLSPSSFSAVRQETLALPEAA